MTHTGLHCRTPGAQRDRPLVRDFRRRRKVQGMTSLREEVENLLPNWRSWYPSLFDAAVDLGVIRARVCDPNSLLLSNRHASVRAEAAQAHRERWEATENPPEE